jgi:hypothetical protein
MRVKMVQQLSGTRGDGTPWPGPGQEFDAAGDEFTWLTHTGDSQSHPIAVPVIEDRKVEAKVEKRPAPEDPKVETRKDDDDDERDAPPWEDDDEPDEKEVVATKRGPGRPRKDSLPK